MRLPKTSAPNTAGFTIVEVVIALGLMTTLIGLGLALSMDVWRGTSFRSEQDLVISLLYKARSRAVSNVNESDHGLYIDEANRQYWIFEGDNYATASSTLPFEMSPTISFMEPQMEIVFLARIADTKESGGYNIELIGEGKENMVLVNAEGGISW